MLSPVKPPQQPRVPLSKCPCQRGALQCHGDGDREEGEEDPSMWDGTIPALISDVPGSS